MSMVDILVHGSASQPVTKLVSHLFIYLLIHASSQSLTALCFY